MSKDRSQHYAFARGYYDGRLTGNDCNPYDGETHPQMRALYRDGYEWGVTDYCAEAHPEEVNQ